MADKEILDIDSILNIIDTDSNIAKKQVSQITKTKRAKPSSTSSDLPDFSAEIEVNTASKKARKQTNAVELDLDSEVGNTRVEEQEEIKAIETETDLQQSLTLQEQTEVKPKRTRKPRTTTPKEKKEPKPKVKKPTKEELEVVETQERRANFEVDYYYHELDEMVVEPTEEYLEILSKSFEIGFDIETFGNLKQSDAFEPELGEIRLIQVYLPDVKKVIVWDLGTIDNRKYPSYKDIPGYGILISKLASKTTQVYIHNAAFENKWVWEKFNIPILNVVDSMILSQVYYAGLIRGFNRIGISKPNSLDQVVWRLFEVKLDKTDQSYDYACPITNRQLNYGAKDAKYTYKAGVELLRMCYAEGLKKVVDAELAAIPAFAMMCNRGVPFDVDIARSLLADYEAEASKVLQPWLDRFPDCNPGSPKQVLACLAELNIFPTALDPKTGLMKPCTNNPTLTPYALEDPLIESLLFWRSLKKDCQYLEGYIKSSRIQKGFQVVRTVYTQNAPQCTGRSGSSKPNLQNIPKLTPKREKAGLKPIRAAFRVPDGYKMIIVDLAASHAQIARFVSQDKQLKEAYATGVKLHFFTASGILKMRGVDAPPAELAKAKKDKDHPLYKEVAELYDPAKTVFYGCVPLTTQILTRDGWKYRHELKIGESVASHNPQTGFMEWTPVLNIFDYQDADLIRLDIKNGSVGNTRWSITCTPNHRWFGTDYRMINRQIENRPAFFEAKDIVKANRILTSSKLLCDGVDAFLPEQKYDFDWVKYVLSLSSDARTAWLSACLVSEGHLDKQGSWNFTQNPGNICNAMKLAAFLEGHRITTYADIGTGKHRYATQRVRMHRRPWITGQKMTKTPVGKADVWCVATKNSTFVIREGETITITGNSLNLNGASTLQASFLKKADMLVDIPTCKLYVEGGRKAYSGLYKFQQKQIADANREIQKFTVKLEDGTEKKVGVYAGVYGTARSCDGGRLFIEKMPSKYKEAWEVKGTDAVSYAWLRPEGTGMKKAMGLIVEHLLFTPDWGAWLAQFTHDEVGLIVKEEWAYDCAKFTLETVTNCFKEIVPDYEAEDYDPNSYIRESWADK